MTEMYAFSACMALNLIKSFYGINSFGFVFVHLQESTDDELLAPLNLIICLVARYFNQTDLGDSG